MTFTFTIESKVQLGGWREVNTWLDVNIVNELSKMFFFSFVSVSTKHIAHSTYLKIQFYLILFVRSNILWFFIVLSGGRRTWYRKGYNTTLVAVINGKYKGPLLSFIVRIYFVDVDIFVFSSIKYIYVDI